MAKNKTKQLKKKTLIYGGGAIGSFIAACLIKAGHKVFFLCRGENYKYIKSIGLNVRLNNNNKLIKNFHLKESKNFIIIKNLEKIKKIYFSNIFITTKINQSLKKIFSQIEKFIDKKTLIVTPCTSIPFWWFKCLNSKLQEKFKIRLNPLFLKNIKRKNLVGMTMWLSGRIDNPGNVTISHVQRGFPIKEVFLEKKKQVDNLRKDLKKTTISPAVKNIFSEIFIKSINSLAFNMIAIKYNQTNAELAKNYVGKKEILEMLKEGDGLLKRFKIKIYQTPWSRINQTLKSRSHTMSMLHALKNKKKIELKYLWKSFKKLTYQLNYKMIRTNKTYNEVVKKIYGNI